MWTVCEILEQFTSWTRNFYNEKNIVSCESKRSLIINFTIQRFSHWNSWHSRSFVPVEVIQGTVEDSHGNFIFIYPAFMTEMERPLFSSFTHAGEETLIVSHSAIHLFPFCVIAIFQNGEVPWSEGLLSIACFSVF